MYRGVSFQGASNRAQALPAAAGIDAASSSADDSRAARGSQPRGDAADSARRRGNRACGRRRRTCAMAASHSARERACSDSLRDQLDDPQQLVADVRMLAGEQPGKLLQPAIAPDPAMHEERDDRAAAKAVARKLTSAAQRRRIPQAVEGEHQPGRRPQAANEPRRTRRPRSILIDQTRAAKFVQLGLQVAGQLQPVVRL